MSSIAEKPTLSVLMPNYNYGRYLRGALEALLSQSFLPTEIIIIDDASTDDSVSILESFAAREPRIRLIVNPQNRGVLFNLERLLEMATGDYVVGCASDDMVLPGFFEKSLALLAQNPSAGLCSATTRAIDEDGVDRGVTPCLLPARAPTFLPPERARRLMSLYGNWIVGFTAIYRREFLIEAGGFMPELRSFTDYFIAKVMALKHGACFIPEPLVAVRVSNTTYSVRDRCYSDAFRNAVATASTLMRTRYAEYFPAGYDRVWERDIAFESERMALRARRAERGREHRVDSNPVARLSARPRTWLGRAGSLVMTSYLLVKYRPVLTLRRFLYNKTNTLRDRMGGWRGGRSPRRLATSGARPAGKTDC